MLSGLPWGARPGRSVQFLVASPRGRWGLACTVPGPPCVAPAQPNGSEQPFRNEAREPFDEVEVRQSTPPSGPAVLVS